MNITGAQKWITQSLEQLYEESERTPIASLVLEHLSGLSKTQIILNKNLEISVAQHSKLSEYIERLLQHEPVQYVLNKSWFYGMELYVDKAVLIPRPETEELVDWIISDIKASGKDVFEKRATDADVTRQLKILDIGSGSGCIALALKKAMPRAEVWGCDVSEEALNVARRNGSTLDIRVDFQGVNFLDEAAQELLPAADVLVSNPPYIPLGDKEAMNKNVVAYEPHSALFVPDGDPLVFYKAIVHFAKKRLYQNGVIYIEVHEDLGSDVVALFKEAGYLTIELRRDMQGKERMVKIKL